MNGEQIAYQIGRAIKSNYDAASLLLATGFGARAVQSFCGVNGPSDDYRIIGGSLFFALSGAVAFYGLRGGLSRLVSAIESGRIKEKPADYPLEHAERIIIEDKDGLGEILERTRKGGNSEWGTLLKAYGDGGVAVVYDILDIERGKKEGLIREEKRNRLEMDILGARDMGYSGCHHYHRDIGPSWFAARNYAIDLHDRVKPEDWINLLSFNLSDGPEIIGFNRSNVYISPGKDKKDLFRATPREINAHLCIRTSLSI